MYVTLLYTIFDSICKICFTFLSGKINESIRKTKKKKRRTSEHKNNL